MRKGSVSTLTHDYYWTLQVYGIIIACVAGEEALLQWSMCVYDDGKAAEQDEDSSSDLKYPTPSDFETHPGRSSTLVHFTRCARPHRICTPPCHNSYLWQDAISAESDSNVDRFSNIWDIVVLLLRPLFATIFR